MRGDPRRSVRHRGSTIYARLVAVIALLALAVTYLSPLVNVEWNAWRYDHGHLSLTSSTAEHTHPWDRDTDAVSGDAGTGDPGMVYTAHGDSVPGVTAIWASALARAVVQLGPAVVYVIPVLAAAAVAIVPASPPPREALSLT